MREKTLSILCKYLKNYFNRNMYTYRGIVAINGGRITNDSFIENIQDGQYYAIFGTVFNDGVYKYDASSLDQGLKDEVAFHGEVSLMAIPQDVIDLAADIEKWQAQYEAEDSANMSPYNSESFAGYSYSKASVSNGGDDNGSSNITWQNAFAARLNMWRKI